MKAKSKKTAPKYRAASACNFDQLCDLGRDNWDYKNHWLITDGFTVTVCAQKNGEEPTQKISLPRGIFNTLIKRYTHPQRVRGSA